MLPVPLLDLRPQYHALRDELHARVAAVMESQQFILGPEVAAFEASVRDYCRAGFAVGMSSGTDAQIAALMAMGVGPGDAVLTTPFTFFATAGCVWRMGARAVFCDIDADTFNLSPAAVERYLREQAKRDPDGTLRTPQGERLRAIIPVHLFGLCADMTPLLRLGEEFGLAVIEDASQAIGAECPLVGGAVGSAGSMGEWGWYSFFPSKNLGAMGDAGLATGRAGQDEALLRALRMHGMTTQYYHDLVGGNFRLDALQAAVLSVKLPHLDAWSDARRVNAARYRELFVAAGLAGRDGAPITLPAEPWAGAPGVRHHHIYHQYVVRAPRRDGLLAHLRAADVGCAVYYPLPLHLQKCFAPWGGQPGDFPVSEQAACEVLALPIFPEITPEQQRRVVSVVADFYAAA